MRTVTQYFRPASPESARRVICEQASRRAVIVYIRELRTRPEPRRMVCRWSPDLAERTRLPYDPIEKDTLLVWDLEKGDYRTVSLDRVEEIAWNEPAADREAARRNVEAMKAQLAEWF